MKVKRSIRRRRENEKENVGKIAEDSRKIRQLQIRKDFQFPLRVDGV